MNSAMMTWFACGHMGLLLLRLFNDTFWAEIDKGFDDD